MKLDMVSTVLFFITLCILILIIISIINFKKIKTTRWRSLIISILVSSVLMLIVGTVHFINQTKNAINIPIVSKKQSSKVTNEVIQPNTPKASSSSSTDANVTNTAPANITIYDSNHQIKQELNNIHIITQTSSILTYTEQNNTDKKTINLDKGDTIAIQ